MNNLISFFVAQKLAAFSIVFVLGFAVGLMSMFSPADEGQIIQHREDGRVYTNDLEYCRDRYEDCVLFERETASVGDEVAMFIVDSVWAVIFGVFFLPIMWLFALIPMIPFKFV